MTEQETFASWLVAADNLGALYEQACAAGNTRDMQAHAIRAQLLVLQLFKSLGDDMSIAELPFKAVMTALEGATKGTWHPLLSTSKTNPGPPTDDPIRVAMKATAVALVMWLTPALGRRPAAETVAAGFSKAGMLGHTGMPLSAKAILAWHGHPTGNRMSTAFAALVDAEFSALPEVDSFLALSDNHRIAWLKVRAGVFIENDRLAKGAAVKKPVKRV